MGGFGSPANIYRASGYFQRYRYFGNVRVTPGPLF